MNRALVYIALWGLGFLVIHTHFGELILHPGQYMLDTGIDGLKNYYNPMYYLKYDPLGWHFSGMNYPFGEHLVFTDGQPILAYTFHLLQSWGINVADHIPAIFNLLMFASILLTMWILYQLGRHYLLPDWYAALIAIIIAAMSPQLHRLAGHYALAYPTVIPLIWWLSIQAHPDRHKSWIYVGLIVWSLFFFSLIHVYYVMIGGVFVLAYFLVYALSNRHHTALWKRGLIYAVAAVATPLILFKLYLVLTDPVADRPVSPYGFFSHITYWEAIFMPQYGPLWDFYNQFGDIRDVVPEGWAYVGMVGFITLLFTVFRWGNYIVHGRFDRLGLTTLPRNFHIAFWAGVLVLFFSFGWPFNWNLHFVVDWLGPLKQFRSLGRFAWVFYYTFTLYTGIYMYLIFKRLCQKNLKVIGGWMLFLVLLFWGGEMWIYLQSRKERIEQWDHNNILAQPRFDYVSWLRENSYEPDDFQAILPIPAYFIGSEKFSTEYVNFFSTREGITASYQTGLPLTTGLLSRTSLSQSLELVQLLSNEYIEKTVLEKYANDKPLLVLVVDEVALSDNEQNLLSRADTLSQKENITLLKLDLKALESQKDSVIYHYEQLKDTVQANEEGVYTQSAKWYYYDTKGNMDEYEFGERVYEAQEGEIVVYDSTVAAGGEMLLSLWVKADPRTDGFPVVYLQEYNPQGEQVNYYEVNPKFLTDVYQDFVSVKRYFYVSDSDNRFVCTVRGKYIGITSILIRPVNSHIFRPVAQGKSLMYNNYYYTLD